MTLGERKKLNGIYKINTLRIIKEEIGNQICHKIKVGAGFKISNIRRGMLLSLLPKEARLWLT